MASTRPRARSQSHAGVPREGLRNKVRAPAHSDGRPVTPTGCRHAAGGEELPGFPGPSRAPPSWGRGRAFWIPRGRVVPALRDSRAALVRSRTPVAAYASTSRATRRSRRASKCLTRSTSPRIAPGETGVPARPCDSGGPGSLGRAPQGRAGNRDPAQRLAAEPAQVGVPFRLGRRRLAAAAQAAARGSRGCTVRPNSGSRSVRFSAARRNRARPTMPAPATRRRTGYTSSATSR